MKTITIIIILCFITQVLQTNGLIQLKNSLATSDSPLLMKILQLVDTATSDEHLLQVTLKLLRSLCICMRETLKAKEDYFNIGNHSLEPAEPSGNEGKIYDLYRNIYNNTCFNLRQELTNRTHKFIVDEESAFLNHTNCGKEERNETYNKRNDSDKSSAVIHSIPSRLEQVLFKALIQTKNLHEYRLRRYDLFGKGAAQTKSTLRHCLIVILTLYPQDQKLYSRKHNIDEKDLNNTLYTKSPIDVDIIDTKHDQKRKEKDESIKAEKFSECNLLSLYNFLTKSDRKNLIKVYKFIRKRDTIKIYIQVNIRQNHTDLINNCCENDTILPQCIKDLINNFITQPNLLDDIYLNTITNIKSLVKQYETKLNDTKHHNISATTVQDEKNEEHIVVESTTKPSTDANRINHKENDMHVSVTKSNESSKFDDVTHAIVLLNDFVSKQNTKSYLKTHQTDKTDKPWTDFVLKEEPQPEFITTCNPINISTALDVKSLQEKSQHESISSLPLYVSNKDANTQKYILENVVETTPTFKQHETSNNKEKNESQGVALSISQEKYKVKEASTSRIDMENVANNAFTIDSYSTNNDVNTELYTVDIMQNTTIANRVDSTVTPTPTDNEKFTEFTSRPLNTTLIPDSRITEIAENYFETYLVRQNKTKVSDSRSAITASTVQSTEPTLHYSLNPDMLSFTNNTTLSTDLETKAKIPEEYFVTDHSTTLKTIPVEDIKRVKKKSTYKTTDHVTTLSTLIPTFDGEQKLSNIQSIPEMLIPIKSTDGIRIIAESETHNKTTKPFASEGCKASLSNALPNELSTKKYNKLPKKIKDIESDRIFDVSTLDNVVKQTDTISFTSESPETKNISETKITNLKKKTMEAKYQNITTKTTLKSLTTLSTLNFTKLHHQSIHDDTEGLKASGRVTSVESMSTVASDVTVEEPYEHTVQKIRTNVTINGITEISPIETTLSQSTQDLSKAYNDSHFDVSDDFIGEAKLYYNHTNADTENNKKLYMTTDLSVTTEENKVTAQDTVSTFLRNVSDNEITMKSIDAVTYEAELEMIVGFNKKVPKSRMTTFQNIIPIKNVASTESIKPSTYSPNPLTNTDILNKQSNQSTQFFHTAISTEPYTETDPEVYPTTTSLSESISFSEFNTRSEDFQSTEGSKNIISESEYKQTASGATVTRFVDNEYGMENYTEMPEIQQSAKSNMLSESLVTKTNESNFTSDPSNINESNDLEITSILKGVNKSETSEILEIMNITSEIPLPYYESETEVTQGFDSTFQITSISDMQMISDEPTKNKLKVPNNYLKALPPDESDVNKLLDKDVSLHICTSPEETFTLKKNVSLNINTNTDSFQKVDNNTSKTLSTQNVSSTVESPSSHGLTSTEIIPSELREFTSEHITINANISADDLLTKHNTTFADKEFSTTPESGTKRPTNNRTDNTYNNTFHSSNYFTKELGKTVDKEVPMGMIAQNKNQTIEFLTMQTSTMAMSPLASTNNATLKTKNTKKITVPRAKKKHHENLSAIADDIVIEKIIPSLTHIETATRNKLLHNELYYFRDNVTNLIQVEIGDKSRTDNIEINDVNEATNSLYTKNDLHENIQDELMPDLKAALTMTTKHNTYANNWSSPQILTYSENKEDIITTVLGPEFIELTNNSDVEEFKEPTLFTPEPVFSALKVSTPATLNSSDVMQNTATNKQLIISGMNTTQTQSFLKPYMETTQYSFIEAFQTTQVDALKNVTITGPIIGSNEVTTTEDLGVLSNTSQVTDFLRKPFNKSDQLFEKETESSIDTTTGELVKMQFHFDESKITPAYVITKSTINGTNVNGSTESSFYKPHRMQTTFVNKPFTYYVTESSTLTKANKKYTENFNAKRPKSSKRKIKLKSPLAFELNIRVGVETNKDGIQFSVLDEKETVYSKSELRLPKTTYFNSNRSGDINIIETLSKSDKKFDNATKINNTASLNDNITNALLKNMNTNRRSNYVTKEDLRRIAAIMEKLKKKPPVVNTKFPQRMKTEKTFVRNTTINEEIQPHLINTTSFNASSTSIHTNFTNINEEIQPHLINTTSFNASSTSIHTNFTNIKHKSKLPGSLTEESPVINHIQSIYKEHIEKIQESMNNTKNGNISATDVLKKFYQAIITLPVNINNSRLNISGVNSTSHKYKTQKDLEASLAAFFRAKNNLGKSETRLNKNDTNKTSTLIKIKIEKLLKKILKGKNLSKSQMRKLKRKLLKNLTSKKNVTSLHKFHDTVKKKYYDNKITDSDKLTTTTTHLPLSYNSTTIETGNATRIQKVGTSSSSSSISQTPNKNIMSFKNNKTEKEKRKRAKGINKQILAEIIFNTTGKSNSQGARRLLSDQIEPESTKLKPKTMYQYTSTETTIGFNKYVTAITPLTNEKRFSGIILSEIDEDLSKPENESNNDSSETSNAVILNSSDVLTKKEVTKGAQSTLDEINDFIELNGVLSQKNDNITYSTAKITKKGISYYNMSTIVTDAGTTVITNTKSKTAAAKYGIMTAPFQTTVAIYATDTPLLITTSENTVPNKIISDNEDSKHTVAMTTVKSNISGKSDYQSDDNAAAVTFPLTSSTLTITKVLSQSNKPNDNITKTILSVTTKIRDKKYYKRIESTTNITSASAARNNSEEIILSSPPDYDVLATNYSECQSSSINMPEPIGTVFTGMLNKQTYEESVTEKALDMKKSHDRNLSENDFHHFTNKSIMDSSTTDYTSTSTPNNEQLKPTPYMFYGLSTLLPEVQSLSNTKNVSAEYNFPTTANIFEHKADSDESSGTLIKEIYKRKRSGKKNVSKEKTNKVNHHFEITKTSTATYPSNISVNNKEETITTQHPIEEYFINTADVERDNRHTTLNMEEYEEKKTTKIPAVSKTQPLFIQIPTKILLTEKKLERNALEHEMQIINASNYNKTTITKNTEEQHLSTNTPNLKEKNIENFNEPKKAYIQTSQNINKEHLVSEKIFGDTNYISTVTVKLPTSVTNIKTSEITLPPQFSRALNEPLTETQNLPITTLTPVDDDSVDMDAFMETSIEKQNGSKTEPTFIVIDRYTNPTDIEEKKVNSNVKDNANLIKLKVDIVKNETYINSSLQKKEDNVTHEKENKNNKILDIDRLKSTSVNTAATTVTTLTLKDYDTAIKTHQSNEIFVENFTQQSNLVYDETTLPLPKGIFKNVVGTTRSNILQDSTDLPLVSNSVNTSAMIPKINLLDPYKRQIVANQSIENKNVNYQTFADNVTENNNIISKNSKIATQNIIIVTDSVNQVTKVSSDASTHGDNTSFSETRKYDKILETKLKNANKTQLVYLVDKSVNVSGSNIRYIINASKNNAYDQRDHLVSIKQNRSKKLQEETPRNNTKRNFFLNIHDGEKNISVIRTPTLTHVKVTKLNPVNQTTVNLKPEVQKLLLISRMDRTYQNGTIEKGFRSNSKSLLPIESRDFKRKKTIEIFSSRLNRPYSSFTTATAVTKNIRYNTYRPISKEELELLKYYNEHVSNTALDKQVSEKPHPPVTGFNYSSNARKSGVSSLQSESKPNLRAANYSEAVQMIRAENRGHGDKGLHIALERKNNLNQPIEMIKIPHSAEIDRISHPILEININSPQIGTNGDSPPMIEINGNPLPIEINRHSVPIDSNRNQVLTGINRNSVPMEITRYSVPIEINRNPVPMGINRNSAPMDVNRYPVTFDINRNSAPLDMNRNPVAMDINRNSAPMDVNGNPVPLDMNRNSAPMNMNRNPVAMDINRNSAPIDMNRNPVPVDMNRNSAPMDMNRNPVPIDMNRNPVPLDMNRNSAPMDINRNPVPMDINRNSSPMDMNKNSAPIEIDRNSVTMDINRNPVPLDMNKNSAPMNMNRNPVAMDINRNSAPIDMNRNPVPLDMNRNSAPMDMNRNPVLLDKNKNPVPMNINRNSTPMHINRNPAPFDMNRNSAPMDINRNPVPTNINRNSAPMDMNRNSASMHVNRNPMPLHKNKNLAPTDINKNSAPMDVNRNPIPLNMNRNSAPMDMNRNPVAMDINRNSAPMDVNRNPVAMDINRNSAPIDMNRNPVPLVDMNRNSAPIDMNRNPVPKDINRNSAPMDMNKNSAPIKINGDSMPIEIARNPIPQKDNRSYIPEETNSNSVPMEINRDSPRTFEINRNIPPTLNLNRNTLSVINPPSIIDKNKNAHKRANKNRYLLADNNKSPSKITKPWISASMFNNNGNLPPMIENNSLSVHNSNRNPPAVIDINRYSLVGNKNSPSVVHNKWNLLSMFGNNYKNSPSRPDSNEKSSIGTDIKMNRPSMTDSNKNSSSMDANMKTNKKSAPRNVYNQINNSTIKTKIISARNTAGIKKTKAIVAAKKKILPMKEIKRKLLLTFGNNKKPLSIIGNNRKTFGALEINRNKHSKIVTKNFKQIGPQKEILLDSFEKSNPYAVKIKTRKSQKPGLKKMKIGTGRKALMTMNTQDFLSQHRYVTPRSVVQKNTKPYNDPPTTNDQRSVRKSILRPIFDHFKAAERLEHKLKPKPVFLNNEIFQAKSMSHRLSNKIHQKVRPGQNNQPMRMMTKKAKVNKKEIEDPMSYMFTGDYMKMTRRPAFNDRLRKRKGSNIFENNYDPSPSYRRSFIEKSNSEVSRTPRRGRTIYFLSPTAAYDQYN